MRQLFDEPPLLAYERAVRAGINYIIVGPPERRVHEGVEADSIQCRRSCRGFSGTLRFRFTKSAAGNGHRLKGSHRLNADEWLTFFCGYFLQKAIRCQPSGRTHDRGKALNVPTNIVLKATPFQPL